MLKRWLLVLFSVCLVGKVAIAQEYIPGNTYLSTDEHVEYIHGNLPIILSAPHGGEKKPSAIPDRQCAGCVYVNDTNTQELAREVSAHITELTGCYPFMILNRLHRTKLDANRNIVEAADGDPLAEEAWTFYHNHVEIARSRASDDFGKGLFLDLHGHGHEIQRLELGYLLSRSVLEDQDGSLDDRGPASSVRSLSETNILNLSFSDLIQGSQSFGELMEDRNVDAVPSQSDPYPNSGESYFTGGFNTQEYGSRSGGTIDAIQIECHQEVRFVDEERQEFAIELAEAIVEFMSLHYFDDFGNDPCPVVSIKELGTDVVVFPIPSNDIIEIESKVVINQVQIFDLLGQMHLQNNSLNNNKNTIDLSHLPRGTYILRLINVHSVHSEKLIIKN